MNRVPVLTREQYEALDLSGCRTNLKILSILIATVLLVAGCELTIGARETATAMPNLVGKTYKDAVKLLMNTPYEEKLIYEDLLENRVIWREKNWVVVTQQPSPGTKFDEVVKPCVGVVKNGEEPGLAVHDRLTCDKHLTKHEQFLADNAAKKAASDSAKNEQQHDNSTTSTVGPSNFEKYLLAQGFEKYQLAWGSEKTNGTPYVYYRQILDSEGCSDVPCWKFAAYVTGRTCPQSFYMRLGYWDRSGKVVQYAKSDDLYPFPEVPVIFTIYDYFAGDNTLTARFDRFYCF
jgi:hypothetical protein